MNHYIAELKRITDNFEYHQSIEELQMQLQGLSSLIENNHNEAIKTPIKLDDMVSDVIYN